MISPPSLRRVRSRQSPATARAVALWWASPSCRSSSCCRRTEPRSHPLLRARLRLRSRQRSPRSCRASDAWARPAQPDRRARASANDAAAPPAVQAHVADPTQLGYLGVGRKEAGADELDCADALLHQRDDPGLRVALNERRVGRMKGVCDVAGPRARLEGEAVGLAQLGVGDVPCVGIVAL